MTINPRHMRFLAQKIQDQFGANLNGNRFAIWAADAETEPLVDWLIEQGATVCVHDQGSDQETSHGDQVEYEACHWDTVKHADALLIAADGPKYRGIDPGRLRWYIGQPLVFDPTNCLNMEWFKYGSFKLYRDTVAQTQEEAAVCLPFSLAARENDESSKPRHVHLAAV